MHGRHRRKQMVSTSVFVKRTSWVGVKEALQLLCLRRHCLFYDKRGRAAKPTLAMGRTQYRHPLKMTRSLSSSCFLPSFPRWYGIFAVALLLFGMAYGEQETPETPSYGVDVSFPMQHPHVTAAYQPLGDGIPSVYDHFLQGCRDFYKEKQRRCDDSERDRISLNLQQPSVMQNFTAAGYAKLELPRNLMKQVAEFWKTNEGQERIENWPAGNTYTNHWKSPTYMLGLTVLRNNVIQSVKEILEAWSGQSLVFTSLYGIRVYKEGAILAPHVDRLPLVTSAIINVAQDVDEPWVLEVIGHDGKAHNITMDPGDMVLYESHSVLHGRPFPLKGRFYANIFVHFEPHGYTERHNEKREAAAAKAKREYLEALENPAPKVKASDLPDYIERGSEEEARWRQDYIYQVEPNEKVHEQEQLPKLPLQPMSTSAHTAAASGNLVQLKRLAKEDPSVLLEQDRNGWRPIHEAARGGHADVVEYLVKNGADVNERTNDGRGATPLWWAENVFEDDHAVVQALRRHGAVNVGLMRNEL